MKNALTSDKLAMVNKVTDEACERLGYDEAIKAIVGARVLGFANKGERRYDTLLAITLDKNTRLTKKIRFGQRTSSTSQKCKERDQSTRGKYDIEDPP